MEVLKENANFISDLPPTSTYKLSLDGPFAKMSWSEFKKTILMDPQDCSATKPSYDHALSSIDPSSLPHAFDWRDKAGVVSEVKNQGSCGSCWTFSTTGALEAHFAIHNGAWRTSRLSEQQLIDCAQDFDNHGCNGGLPSHAFEYIHNAGGLSSEFFYPYEAKGGACRFKKEEAKIGAKTLKSFNITQGDELQIMAHLVHRGPVSIAFEVVPGFNLYKSGVYTSDKCKSGTKDVNHAVLAVGYGVDHENGGIPYWIVKNSWGKNWGDEGYFKIVRGKNMCGLASCASYPVLEEKPGNHKLRH